MNHTVAKVAIAGALLGAVAGGAFVAISPSGAPADQRPPRAPARVFSQAPSDFQVLDSISEMRERTDKAAIVEVVAETWRGEFNGFPRRTFSLRVIDPVKNTSAGEIIKLSQRDPSAKAANDDPPDLVKVGDRYLVFLSAWRWPETGPLNRAYSTWLGETVYAPKGDGFVQYGVARSLGAAPVEISAADLAGLG